MTKKKANAGPKGFQPGNQAAVKEKPLIKTHFTIDPDQLAWLRSQPDGISPTVRKAIDLYRNIIESEQENKTMKAKLTTKYEGSNIKYELRSGEKGTGKVLWECTSWDNPRATENAEQMAAEFIRRNNITVTNSMDEGIY